MELEKLISKGQARPIYCFMVDKEQDVKMNSGDVHMYQGEGIRLSVGKTEKEVGWCVCEKLRCTYLIFPAVIVEKTRIIRKVSRKVVEIYQLDKSLVPELFKKGLLDGRVAERTLNIKARHLDFSSPIKN